MIIKLIKKYKIIIIAFLITLICIILNNFISSSYPIKILHNYMYDSFFLIKSKFIKNNKISDDVIIITIDEDSLSNYVENKFIKWPWPRKLYAQISQYLIDKGAKSVVFNINFSTPDLDHHGIPGYGEVNDNRFYNVIYNTKKVILPFEITLNNESDKIIDTLKINNIDRLKYIKTYKSLISPFSLYTVNNNNFGFTNIETEIDNKIRNYIPYVKIGNNYFPSLAVATYLLNNNKDLPKSLQLDKNGSFRLNFYTKKKDINIFKKISFYSILSDYLNELMGIQAEIPGETYKDKIIFIGTTSKVYNIQNTNILNREAYPNTEIHALAYQNLIEKNWIRNYPNYFEIPIFFIFTFLLIFLCLCIKPRIINLLLFILLIISINFLNLYFFIYFSTLSESLLFIILFIFLVYLFIQLFYFESYKNRKEKKEKSISSNLNLKISKKIKNKDKKLLSKAKKKIKSSKDKDNVISVLYIEIDGFYKYIENNPAEIIFETLKKYINKFKEVIIDNKGFIYKILENELIILFGSPIHYGDHADMAVKTAFDCYNISKDLKNEYNLNIRMGINSGEVIIDGLALSDQKIEYVAFGNCLKTSEKLKDFNKIFDTNILIGKETKKLIKNVYSIDYLGEFIFNKKNTLNEIYYFKEAKKQHKERFKLMANAYENNDISSFKRFISYFLENSTDFGPALFYIKHHKNNEKDFGEPIKLIYN